MISVPVCGIRLPLVQNLNPRDWQLWPLEKMFITVLDPSSVIASLSSAALARYMHWCVEMFDNR